MRIIQGTTGKMQKMQVETTVMVTSLEICKHVFDWGSLAAHLLGGSEFPRPMSDGQGGPQGLYLGVGEG